jgi:hypothetical protein
MSCADCSVTDKTALATRTNKQRERMAIQILEPCVQTDGFTDEQPLTLDVGLGVGGGDDWQHELPLLQLTARALLQHTPQSDSQLLYVKE